MSGHDLADWLRSNDLGVWGLQQAAEQVAGACRSVFIANPGANRSRTFSVGPIFKKVLNFPYSEIGVVAFARNAPCHSHANEARSVVRLIVTIVDNERWPAGPHGLARRTDFPLVYHHTRKGKNSGVRRILDRHNPGWQRVFGLVVRIAPNHEQSAAPEATGSLRALFVEVARSADCR